MSDSRGSMVTGIYSERSRAARAIRELGVSGFSESQISLLMSKGFGSQFRIHESSKAPEGAAAGAAGGGVLGGLIGGLTAVGTIATGGGVLLAGPIVAALAGVGAGAGAGGLVGALVGYGISEYEARLFTERLMDGSTLIAVECLDDARREAAELILERTGAQTTSTSRA